MIKIDVPKYSGEPRDEMSFWHAQSAFQKEQHWLRHSIAIERLGVPKGVERAIDDGATCGPLAFAAITGRKADEALVYFPEVQTRPWTTRTDMQRALSRAGQAYSRQQETWPVAGLCIVQFVGPWTDRAFAQAALQHTHWIAVLGEYVFDINWNGWLPRENWEDVVLDELLWSKPATRGWRVLTGYEITVDPHRFA